VHEGLQARGPRVAHDLQFLRLLPHLAARLRPLYDPHHGTLPRRRLYQRLHPARPRLRPPYE